MELLDHKLKVAPTAALVLLQSRSLYDSGLAGKFYDGIDFGDVQELSTGIQGAWPHFTTVVLYRKRFIRHLLEMHLQDGKPVQVVVLGAGLDPVSLWLLEHHRAAISGIFEVDAVHMPAKSSLYARLLPGEPALHFIQADITDTLHLLEKLRDAGYSTEHPALVLFEGVIHYIPDELFLNIMQVFRTPNKTNVVLMDYMLPPHKVPAAGRPVLLELIARIEKFIGGITYQYERRQIFQMVELLHGDVAGVDSLQDIEFKLNGRNELFYEDGEGFMEMTAFYL